MVDSGRLTRVHAWPGSRDHIAKSSGSHITCDVCLGSLAIAPGEFLNFLSERSNELVKTLLIKDAHKLSTRIGKLTHARNAYVHYVPGILRQSQTVVELRFFALRVQKFAQDCSAACRLGVFRYLEALSFVCVK